MGLLPRTEQERIRQLCLTEIGTEQNAGKITRIVEDLVRREAEAGLQEQRDAAAAATEKLHDAERFLNAELRKAKAKLRAQKWRDRQKQEDPEFTEKEKRRKQSERAEASRANELDELLKSGQHPTNLERLRKKDGPRLYAPNDAGEKTPITTGGYNCAKLEQVQTASDNAQGGRDAIAQPKGPEGHGPDLSEAPDSLEPAADSPKPHTPGYRYKDFPPKDVRAMHKFISSHTDERPMMICLVCQEQIAPEFSFEAGFTHLHDKHSQLFEDMLTAVKKAKRCPEDHEGMTARHGTGTRKLYCAKCRKLLYRPPKTAQLPKAA